MKHMLLCSALWCLVGAGPVSATSIPTFDITFTSAFVGPNDGTGDNVGFRLLGPGTEIIGGGGTPCCFGSFSPGDEVPGFSAGIFFSGGVGKLGGRVNDFFTILSGGVSLDGGTLPSASEGADLFGSVTFGGGFVVDGGVDDRGNPFLLNGASTGLSSTWDFDGSGFQFVGAFGESGTPPAPTPEPATLVLLGSGLLAASVFGRKRLASRKA